MMPDSPNVSKGIVPVLLGDYLTLSEAAKRLPRVNGRKVHTSTLWRWCRKGCNGIRLGYSRIGRSIMVTEVALQQFFTALAKVDAEQSCPSECTPRRRKRRPQSDLQRQQGLDRAREILVRAKILQTTQD